MRFVVCLLLVLLLASACRFGDVIPIPIRGDEPQVVAVWPIAEGASPPRDELWFVGLAAALSRRGYRVIPPGVTAELLRQEGLASASDLADIGRALRADALMRFDVKSFDADGERSLRSADWDLEWQLISTRGQGSQWAFEHRGYWQQIDADPFDPARSLDWHHQQPDIIPIGGLGGPNFRGPDELLARLHGQAMAHLPMRAQ
jgi:hypothetical protein